MLVKQSLIKIGLLCSVLIGISACNDKTPPNPEPKPAPKTEPIQADATIAVDAAVYDFGKVPAGNSVTHVFKIKNTGTANLVIDRTEAS